MKDITINAVLKDDSEVEIIMIDTVKKILITVHFDLLKFDDIKALHFRG